MRFFSKVSLLFTFFLFVSACGDDVLVAPPSGRDTVQVPILQIHDTTVVYDTVVVHDTVTQLKTDTLWLTKTVHDTVERVVIRVDTLVQIKVQVDTVIRFVTRDVIRVIHDTVFVHDTVTKVVVCWKDKPKPGAEASSPELNNSQPKECKSP